MFVVGYVCVCVFSFTGSLSVIFWRFCHPPLNQGRLLGRGGGPLGESLHLKGDVA